MRIQCTLVCNGLTLLAADQMLLMCARGGRRARFARSTYAAGLS